MTHSWHDDYCLRCGREESRCICEIEFVHGPAYGEHRGSRPHMDEDPVREAPAEPIDRMFREAAEAGFEPVTEEQAEAMRQKLRGFSAQIHGGRR